MRLDDGWLVPEKSPPWLNWRFGTRTSILRNELAQVKQVHGAKILSVDRPGLAGEADGLITHTPSVTLGIKTADCLPILMADLETRSIAAVHAGWRGTAQGIVGEAIRCMGEIYGTKPMDLMAAMGPGIGCCCFEVGAEVAREFAEFDGRYAQASGKCHLDLQAMNAWQLERAGVKPHLILRNELCTMCDPDRFWSFRKEGELAGRMWSLVEIQEG